MQALAALYRRLACTAATARDRNRLRQKARSFAAMINLTAAFMALY
jgi:hypothetical protein